MKNFKLVLLLILMSCASNHSELSQKKQEIEQKLEEQEFDIDLTQISVGDVKHVQSFDVYDETTEAENKEIEATIDNSFKEIATTQEKEFFELGKKAPKINLKYMFPIENTTRLSSKFGMRHGKMHLGVDIPGKPGTAILAANDGVVVFSGIKSGYGNIIILKHLNDIFSIYAHAKKLVAKKGDLIKKGQLIATVGTTGHTTGPHLHFEIRDGKKAIDPLKFFQKQETL
jgi:murein DD-endopeptidase MepM/ murein hydrolase activator NlpD